MRYNKENYKDKTLSLDSSVSDAKDLLGAKLLDYIVVLDKNEFVGVLLAEQLAEVKENFKMLDIRQLLKPIFLEENFTLFDWLRITSVNNLVSIPIVDEKDKSFLGIFSFKDFSFKFLNTGLNVENATVLVLKKRSKSFSYSEVFQIAEANEAKVFGSYINSSDEEETEIVLNIYHIGLNELLQSYRRYDYDVVSFHEEDLHHETLKANSDYFNKYLTV